jgi:phosphoadenosine phosphosulfate reductase
MGLIQEPGWKSAYVQTVKQVQEEIERPFEEKLKRTKEIIRMFACYPGAHVACSFGKDSMIVLHLALQVNAKIPVNFNNTLIEFPETMKMARTVPENWDLDFSMLRPDPGVNFWTVNDRAIKEHLRVDDGKKHSNLCCYWLKEKPSKLWRRARKLNLSFTGITAVESRNRLWTACAKGTNYYAYKDECYKVHPLMYWTPDEVWAYTRDEDLPVNEAYDRYGLVRIGCMWCMSHKTWQRDVCRLNPRVYEYIMRRYRGAPRITDKEFYEG